jgi:hypothetical protein
LKNHEQRERGIVSGVDEKNTIPYENGSFLSQTEKAILRFLIENFCKVSMRLMISL